MPVDSFSRGKPLEYVPGNVMLILMILCLPLLYPLSNIIPPSWSGENHVIENLQVFVLVLAMIIAWVYAHRMKDLQNRRFWKWIVPIMMLLIGRELSWGRVFYPVQTASGQIEFLSKNQLWFGPMVNPLIAVLIISFVIAVFRFKLYQVFVRLWKQHRFPTLHFVLVVTYLFISLIFEKHLHINNYVVMEELSELMAYLCFVGLSLNMGYYMKGDPLKRVNNSE